MDKNIVGAQMDVHLKNIQRETRETLNRFKESGTNIDMKYFLKQSITSLKQTCERFGKEWEMNKNVQMGESKGSKRKSETTTSNDTEQTKKQKSVSHNLNAIESGANPVFFCDYCTDPDDSSKSFSGTAEEVRAHCVAFHSNEPISQPFQRQSIPSEPNTMFYCDHCINSSGSGNLFSGTIHEVYEHWLASHLDKSIALPFQFHAVDVAKCFHCAEIGTYHDLVEHHKSQHKDEFFTISDRLNGEKCGICHHVKGNLIDHFKSSHESVSPPKIFNPIFYSDERITELTGLNAEKEHRCIECSQTFGTHTETYKHFAVDHSQEHDAIPFVGDQTKPAYLICGFCMKFIAVGELLHHFRKHSYSFSCSKCAHQSTDLAELVFHERKEHSNDSLDYHCSVFPDWLRNKFLNTKMVFPNGLVLKNYNVLGTSFDESRLFGIFVDGVLDAKKERLEQMMKSIQPNPNANETNQKEQVSQDASAVPAAVGAGAATNDSKLIAELNKQRSLRLNLLVNGIKDGLKSIGLPDVFLKLCQLLEVNVSANDIIRIEEKKKDRLSVQLHRSDLIEMILNRMKIRAIWSNELMPLSKGEIPWKISVNKELTPYYCNIIQKAFELKEQNKVHWFQVSNNGLAVKRTPTEAVHVVRSMQELLDFIHKIN